MSYISEKVAYLDGLADGLGIEADDTMARKLLACRLDLLLSIHDDYAPREVGCGKLGNGFVIYGRLICHEYPR